VHTLIKKRVDKIEGELYLLWQEATLALDKALLKVPRTVQVEVLKDLVVDREKQYRRYVKWAEEMRLAETVGE
jgi:hypothetical protein